MTLTQLLTLAIATYTGSHSLIAQTTAFNTGSNGSYGAMNITTSTTLQLPPDGVFHCTTVTISPTANLQFARNSLNTPVIILATGDVVISGSISLTGKASSGSGSSGIGGPGGFDGGLGTADAGSPSGPGSGPGGGSRGVYNEANPSLTSNGGDASYRTVGGGNAPAAGSGSVYGSSLVIPLVGGSGGGGAQLPGVNVAGAGYGGGGGGGAILIASNSRIVFPNSGSNAWVDASGGSGGGVTVGSLGTRYAGSGCGGAIRLVAPQVTGRVNINVAGGQAGPAKAGRGRFRVDTFDRSGLVFLLDQPDVIGSVMVAVPSPMPKLSIANAAGTAVAEGAAGPVSVILPTGTSPNQTIKVRARDFGGVVPIRVRLTPESGDAITVDAQIDNTVNNPATVDVPVTLPINTGVNVMVYTR